jgi:hypothetical protein
LERALPIDGMLLGENDVWRGGWLMDTLKTHVVERAARERVAGLTKAVREAAAIRE